MDWKRKLSSRKFWLSLASFISSLLVAFNVAEDTVTKIVAIVSSLGAVVAYVISEAIIDSSIQSTGKDENNCYNWGVPVGSYSDVTDKDASVQYYAQSFLNRTLGMFKYNGLPDSIPQRDLELLMQVGGFACIAKVNGELYAFSGGLGGERNAYYMPTICVVANPYLNISKTFKIDEDCIIIPNDPFYCGLMPMLNRYGSLLTEMILQ